MKISPYPKLVAERYDITRKAPSPGELEYYLAHVDHPGGAVLELACGSGRLLVPMAKQGIDISGTDASPHMLAACERRCADENIHPSLYLQPMQQLDLDQQFTMIFIADGTFGLLVEDEDVRSMLERAYSHLEPGGGLAFDFSTPATHPEEEHAWNRQWSNWVEGADGTVIWSRSNQVPYDRRTGVWKEFRVDEKWKDGRLVESEGWVSCGRDYSSEVIEAFCADAGFLDVRVTDHWGDDPGLDKALSCRKPLS